MNSYMALYIPLFDMLLYYNSTRFKKLQKIGKCDDLGDELALRDSNWNSFS